METWNFHLCAHDYSRWFCRFVNDEELASVAEAAESECLTLLRSCA
jgi:hypothetical protein